MTRLSVNINKIATLRNARGGNVPNLVKTAIDCEKFGAEGITVHPRPDERHIRRDDVYALKEVLTTEFNIEGYPSDDFIQMVLQVKPAQVTLVPDSPNILTSNAGWDTMKHSLLLKEVISEIKKSGIRVSIFLDTDPTNMIHAVETGTDRIELYTGPFAENFEKNPQQAISAYTRSSELAASLNLGLNAGHDLNLKNLKYFKNNVKALQEVSIGHALISDSLYFGLENTIQMYKRELK